MLFAKAQHLKKGKKMFHDQIKYVLVLAQIFGLLPIRGVWAKDPQKLIFTWCSKRVIYCVLITCGSLFMSSMALYQMILEGFQLQSFGTFFFNVNGLLISVLFLKLARTWKVLVENVNNVEQSMENYNYKENLRFKFNVILITITIAATVEHILQVLNSLYSARLKINNSTKNYFLEYLNLDYPFIFKNIPYSIFLAVFSLFINWCNVFAWNFIDAFIMIISTTLSYKFRQIRQQVRTGVLKKSHSQYFWTKVRQDYSKISILCKKVDNHLSPIILVSFGTNMYFIVTQLYNSLLARETALESVYFFYSFALLLLRTISVILMGCKVNSDSKKPLSYLLAINTNSYNIEIERFITQITAEEIALTGNNFFFITRSLLFSMAGTIVTYELFLIQTKI